MTARITVSPRRRGNLPQRQRGIALLVAILLVALGTIIAAAIAYDNAMTARRGYSSYAFDQALLIQQGAEALAAYGLRAVRQADPKTLYRGQGWDKPVGPVEIVPGVMLEAQLEDLEGRFNLNNLVQLDGTPDPAAVAAFQNLLEFVGLEPKWASLLVDWIDPDIQPQPTDGAEDSVYMGQSPPYLAPNMYITSASELLALPGFGRDRYVKIAPYVTALPHGSKINVCTASGPVLDAWLGPGHTEFGGTDPTALEQNRVNANGCFPALTDYTNIYTQSHPQTAAPAAATKTTTTPTPGGNGSGVAQNPGPANYFEQTSSYFQLSSVISIGSAEFNLYSVLIQDGSSAGMVRPLLRTFNSE